MIYYFCILYIYINKYFMNYLLNNIEVEIDIEKSENFNFSIWFKV